MTTKRKTSLTPHEVVMVAHAHLVGGIDQHALSSMFSVNPARVAEAIVAIRFAAERHMEIYEMAKAKRKAAADV